MDLLATGTRVDLVLSNLLLPVVDRFTVFAHVKKHFPRVPFAFTAITDGKVREAAVRNGAGGCLLKPFTKQDFLALVRRRIGRPPGDEKHTIQGTHHKDSAGAECPT